MHSRDIRVAVEEIIRIFVGAVQTRNMYGKDHNLSRGAIDELHLKLSEALSDRDEITIGVIGDEIAFEKEPFYEISENAVNFISRLKKIKTEKVSFLKGIEKKELVVLIDLMAGNVKSSGKPAGVEKMLESQNITHIIMGTLGASEKGGEDESKIDIEIAAKTSFQQGIDFLKKVSLDIRNDKPVDVIAARFVVSKIVRNLLKNAHSFLILTALKKRDEYTFSHSINVAIFTMVQAEALGLQEDLLTDIGIAALLHDTGKLAVETAIIQKNATLNQEEMEKMHSHPVEGAEILLETPDMSLLAALSSFEHHVKYDRQGYPQKIYGEKINLASMMITVADVYDALRSKRSYHEPLSPEKVYEEMTKLSGKYFHPDLLDIFFGRIGMYPPGTLVELDNNAIGLVVKESVLDVKRPQVEILYSSKGQKEKEPYIVNLLEKDSITKNYKWSIVRSMALSDKYEIPNKYKPD